jgi:hypothetical protein
MLCSEGTTMAASSEDRAPRRRFGAPLIIDLTCWLVRHRLAGRWVRLRSPWPPIPPDNLDPTQLRSSTRCGHHRQATRLRHHRPTEEHIVMRGRVGLCFFQRQGHPRISANISNKDEFILPSLPTKHLEMVHSIPSHLAPLTKHSLRTGHLARIWWGQTKHDVTRARTMVVVAVQVA